MFFLIWQALVLRARFEILITNLDSLLLKTTLNSYHAANEPLFKSSSSKIYTPEIIVPKPSKVEMMRLRRHLVWDESISRLNRLSAVSNEKPTISWLNALPKKNATSTGNQWSQDRSNITPLPSSIRKISSRLFFLQTNIKNRSSQLLSLDKVPITS